jgi:hypothetical protein
MNPDVIRPSEEDVVKDALTPFGFNYKDGGSREIVLDVEGISILYRTMKHTDKWIFVFSVSDYALPYIHKLELEKVLKELNIEFRNVPIFLRNYTYFEVPASDMKIVFPKLITLLEEGIHNTKEVRIRMESERVAQLKQDLLREMNQ